MEIPNYIEDMKSIKKDKIKETIQLYASNDGILSTYSKFVLLLKTNYNDSENNYYSIETYLLPDMTKIENESTTYIKLTSKFPENSIQENVHQTIDTTQEGATNTENNNNSQHGTTSNQNNSPANHSSTTQQSSNINKTETSQTSSTQTNQNTNIQQETNNNQNNTSGTNNTPSTNTPSTTLGEKNALSKAKSYLNFIAFSYTGLLEQLKFEGFSDTEAKYGVDNCGANWNEQAVKKAKSYLDIMSFSRSDLIEQLKFDGFTSAQAEYGANAVGY